MSYITILFDEKTRNTWDTPVPVEIFDEHMKSVASEVVYLHNPTDILVEGRGLYYVSVKLPSGENVATTVRIKGKTQKVIANMSVLDRSPRETLAWAYARQSLRQASGFSPKRQPSRVIGLGEAVDSYGGQAFYRIESQRPALEFPDQGEGELPSFLYDGRDNPESDPYEGILPRSMSKQWRMINADSEIDFVKIDDSVSTQDARLVANYYIKINNNSPNLPWPKPYRPFYLCTFILRDDRRDYEIECISIPTDFIEYSSPPVNLLFVQAKDQNTRQTGGIRALVNGVRPDAEALLSYLAQGAYSAGRRIAETVVENAIEILQMKKENPFAACIAGYFLLHTQHLEKQSWMRNLANWFDEIPDGAVIYGVSLLRNGRKDAEEARLYLLEAVRRGIPTYTVGLRLLFDSLRTLADKRKNDVSLLSALARVRHIASYTDWNAQTTSFAMPLNAKDSHLSIY
jgi:hypothetical protein